MPPHSIIVGEDYTDTYPMLSPSLPLRRRPSIDDINEPLLPSDTHPLRLPLRQAGGGVITVDRTSRITTQLNSETTYKLKRYREQRSDVAQCAVTPTSSTSTSPGTSKFKAYTPTFEPPTRRKQHPFAKDFEVPQWRLLVLHIGLCALAYPFLLVFVIAPRGMSLFWTRVSIGIGCGVLGFVLGVSLLMLSKAILGAATWATVIHQSGLPNAPGVRLKDLASQSSSSGALSALRLLWDRHSYRGTDRQYREFYDKRPWSLWILFFLLNVFAAGILPFLLGRVTNIEIQVMVCVQFTCCTLGFSLYGFTAWKHQHQDYYEVVVAGDISATDIEQAQGIQSAFENFLLTWTLAPFSLHGSLPSVVSFRWDDQWVYFSEVVPSQLVPGGNGFGTFQYSTESPSSTTDPKDMIKPSPSVGVDPGVILRFPRWGIRIKCVKIPDLPNNLVPISPDKNLTYLFTPRDAIRPLFQDFNLSFPEKYELPFNFSSMVSPSEPLPPGLNMTSIAMGAMFWDNGVANSMKSSPLSLGQGGDGFTTLEHVVVRLNDSFAPHGTFGVKRNSSIPDKDGFPTSIAYDAAVCLELYEPWILEVYNSSVGLPSSMRIVDKAAAVVDMNTEKIKEKLKGRKITDPAVQRSLNSTNLSPVYVVGHQNSANQILKDNGRDSYYVPSPTLISFTGGDGPFGYTELSEEYYAKARALADATNVLPYFAGSGLSVARSYTDQITTNATIANIQMTAIICVVFLMGLISALFVPRLPMDMPQRGFDVYSWFSVFYGRELVTEQPVNLSKNMELRDIIAYSGELKLFHQF